MFKKKYLYLDYAAATPLTPRAKRAVVRASSTFGNPSSLHKAGRGAKEALEEARTAIAAALRARPDEIVFTSGGTEANNLAIQGVARALEATERPLSSMHFIVSSIEHPSVLDCFTVLERRGAQVTYVPVDAEGFVAPTEVAAALTKETVLVSIGYANGEIGTMQPLAALAKAIRHRAQELGIPKPLFHTDASQALAYFSCEPDTLHVDLMTLDAQKIYGPKGIGVLYVRRPSAAAPLPLHRLFEGGGQEWGLRPGTENVPAVLGFAAALDVARCVRERDGKHVADLRQRAATLLQKIPGAKLNGSSEGLPNTLSISFPGLEGEFLAVALDEAGIAVGTGSACLAQKGDASYVIRALGADEETARGTVRISLGRETTLAHIAALSSALTAIIKRQRSV